jgi:hypothetical protein
MEIGCVDGNLMAFALDHVEWLAVLNLRVLLSESLISVEMHQARMTG